MGFSRQEYWSRLPLPTPGDLPHPGIKPVSLMSPLADGFFTINATWEACCLDLALPRANPEIRIIYLGGDFRKHHRDM